MFNGHDLERRSEAPALERRSLSPGAAEDQALDTAGGEGSSAAPGDGREWPGQVELDSAGADALLPLAAELIEQEVAREALLVFRAEHVA